MEERKDGGSLRGELFEDLPETPAGESEKWSPDFELIVELIGSAAALRIAEAFAGSSIYIPKTVLRQREHLEIRRAYKAGATYRELGLKYGYTETHIRNILHPKKTG